MQRKYINFVIGSLRCYVKVPAFTYRGLDAATPLRSANNELQNAIDIRTQSSQFATICSSNRISTSKQKNVDFEAIIF